MKRLFYDLINMALEILQWSVQAPPQNGWSVCNIFKKQNSLGAKVTRKLSNSISDFGNRADLLVTRHNFRRPYFNCVLLVRERVAETLLTVVDYAQLILDENSNLTTAYLVLVHFEEFVPFWIHPCTSAFACDRKHLVKRV